MTLEDFAEELSWLAEEIWYGQYPVRKEQRPNNDYPRRSGGKVKMLNALRKMNGIEEFEKI